jgi:N-acetylglucosamine kinase-like BadF-type ATPase
VAYLLAVDGGNTKTIALVARDDGVILGAGRAGFGDIYRAESPNVALDSIASAVERALADAGIEAADLAVGAFSLAGADWPEDFELIQNAMDKAGYGQALVVVNDALGALRAGSPDGTGVSVVCGTGIATGARAGDGRSWHSSFWQDRNGAGEMGHLVMDAVCRAELGIDPPTALTPRALELFEQPSVERLLHLLTARKSATAESRIGLLAPVLLDAAGNGDATACRIVRELGTRLGDYALAAARQVGIANESFPLVLLGGVFRHRHRDLIDTMLERIRRDAPDVVPIHSPFEPVIGALFLALESAGTAIDDALRDRLKPTIPDADFFKTAKDG